LILLYNVERLGPAENDLNKTKTPKICFSDLQRKRILGRLVRGDFA
jgi:hypothetical protein